MLRHRPAKTMSRAATAEAGAITTLGELPAWNLADLYPGAATPEFKRDLAASLSSSKAFETRWKGKLSEAAAASGADGLGAALERLDAADVEANGGVELQRLAARRGLGRAEHHADLLA